MSKDNSETIHIVVVGDGAVGKTCLLYRYTGVEVSEQYVPTVFDNYTKCIEIGGKQFNVQLWDTAGQEGYDRLRALSYAQASCCLVCFDVSKFDSFTNVKETWIKEIWSNKKNLPLVLVGMQ